MDNKNKSEQKSINQMFIWHKGPNQIQRPKHSNILQQQQHTGRGAKQLLFPVWDNHHTPAVTVSPWFQQDSSLPPGAWDEEKPKSSESKESCWSRWYRRDSDKSLSQPYSDICHRPHISGLHYRPHPQKNCHRQLEWLQTNHPDVCIYKVLGDVLRKTNLDMKLLLA